MKQREIKFRNWYKPQEGRIYSDIIPPLMIYLSYQQTIDSGRTLLFTNEERTWIDESDFEDPILMQYTGLKDKNGKEIYEGDIVKYTTINANLQEEESIAYIDWCTWSYSLFKKYKGERNYFTILDKICCSKIEKIGDIYQNTDLIK